MSRTVGLVLSMRTWHVLVASTLPAVSAERYSIVVMPWRLIFTLTPLTQAPDPTRYSV